MQLVDRYLITIYVIPEKVDEIITAVTAVTALQYGHYKRVYWQSAPGTEYFNVLPSAGQGVSEDEVQQNPTVKLEFSIEQDEQLLNKVIEHIINVHPWEEPVIRISNIQETRANHA